MSDTERQENLETEYLEINSKGAWAVIYQVCIWTKSFPGLPLHFFPWYVYTIHCNSSSWRYPASQPIKNTHKVHNHFQINGFIADPQVSSSIQILLPRFIPRRILFPYFHSIMFSQCIDTLQYFTLFSTTYFYFLPLVR